MRRTATIKIVCLAALAFFLAGAALGPDMVLIGADADALGKVFAFGDLNSDGRSDLFVSGCGP